MHRNNQIKSEMIKNTFLLVFSLSALLFGCIKPEPPVPQTYGEKILGTWICDSIREYLPDNNDSLIYYTTDTIPKTYVFIKSSGKNWYKWNNTPVEMNESEGSFYKDGPLGDIGDTWYITHIDKNTCVLKLNFSGGLGTYITNQYWYYLRR